MVTTPLDGGGGKDTLIGGEGNDTYKVDHLDTVVEELNGGTDTVISTGSTRWRRMSRPTLVDLGTNTQTFDDMSLGAITNGENGWKDGGAPSDQEVVNLDGNQVWRLSSDPPSDGFGGPYSPELSVTAGEPQTSAGR